MAVTGKQPSPFLIGSHAGQGIHCSIDDWTRIDFRNTHFTDPAPALLPDRRFVEIGKVQISLCCILQPPMDECSGDSGAGAHPVEIHRRSVARRVWTCRRQHRRCRLAPARLNSAQPRCQPTVIRPLDSVGVVGGEGIFKIVAYDRPQQV